MNKKHGFTEDLLTFFQYLVPYAIHPRAPGVAAFD